MKDKRGIWNVASGLLSQLLSIAFGLILPRLFILSFGSETNGLLSSVGQVYVYVALLESGIGTASLQALYKSIAGKDRPAANSVLAATHQYYKKIGFIYIAAVFVLTIAFPFVLQTTIPKITVSLIVLLNGLDGVLSYFLYGKYNILLRAEGRNYILTNLNLAAFILTNITKIVLIYLKYDVVVVQAAVFAVSAIRAYCTIWYIRRRYDWIDLKTVPDYGAIAGRKSVLVHKLSNLVFSNTDVIILTVFCGLKTVSVYTLYLSFFNMIKSILFSFLDGIQYKLAQTFHSDFSRFQRMQDSFEAVYMTMTFALYSILFLLITPFLKIYTVGIHDIQYVDQYLPVLFTMVFLLQAARGPMLLVTEYAQMFRETRKQSIFEMIINLLITLILVNAIGIYGALIGTIAALLYRSVAIIWYVNRNILHRNPWITCKRWAWNAALFLLLFLLENKFLLAADTYGLFLVKACPVVIIVTVLYFLCLRLFEKEAFGQIRTILHSFKESGRKII